MNEASRFIINPSLLLLGVLLLTMNRFLSSTRLASLRAAPGVACRGRPIASALIMRQQLPSTAASVSSLFQQRQLQARFVSDSITYSGGQATPGQGGYYGSGGARANVESPETPTDSERAKVLAMTADVQTIGAVMNELSTLESLLEKEESMNSVKALEIRNAIKKLMTAQDVTSALNRLHVSGEPVWGLSVSEREMISYAKEKVNEC